jgi:hypothetical protein
MASRALWLVALEGESSSERGVQFPLEDAGLAAVVGMEWVNPVSDDSPATEACD